MWDGRPIFVRVANHYNRLVYRNVPPIHSAIYQKRPEILKFEEKKRDRTFLQKAIKTAQNKMAEIIMFTSQKETGCYAFVMRTAP